MTKRKRRRRGLSLALMLVLSLVLIGLVSKGPILSGAFVLKGETITAECNIENADKIAQDLVNEVILPSKFRINCDDVMNKEEELGVRIIIECDSQEAADKLIESCKYYESLERNK